MWVRNSVLAQTILRDSTIMTIADAVLTLRFSAPSANRSRGKSGVPLFPIKAVTMLSNALRSSSIAETRAETLLPNRGVALDMLKVTVVWNGQRPFLREI